ncbi:MAG: DUF6750 family protein [Gammaproteobacteria bacterium]|jgi:intracellular multiplication protein IcmD
MNTNITLKIKKYLRLISLCLLFCTSNLAIAGSTAQSLGGIVGNVQSNILTIVSLLIIVAYVAGVGFALAGILQFKAHKDNPQQVPLSKPIVFIAVAACLLFLPAIMSTAGKTVFGSNATNTVSSSVISNVGNVQAAPTTTN